jgi:putative sigma-54 modulation protein
MISKVEITGVHTKVDQKLHDYIIKKIARMDRYLPKHARESAHAEILIKESKVKERKQYTCEVVLRLPSTTITSKETTMNAFAAVDIVEAKLKNQLKKYKETHSSLKLHRRVLARIKRRGSRG